MAQFKNNAMLVKEHKVYTMHEIDMNLEFLGNLLKYAKYDDKKECLEKIDEWLDKRIQLTRLEKDIAC